MDAAYDDRTLRRIIAQLVALAGYAELAAGRCFAIRFLLLLVLRRAEPIMLDFVADAAGAIWPLIEQDLDVYSRPEDATALARRFRLFAAVLLELIEPLHPRVEACARIRRAPGRVPLRPCRRPEPQGHAAPRYHDTS